MTRSVMTTTLSKTLRSSAVCSVERRCAVQAIVFDLPEPAECWMRYELAGAVGARVGLELHHRVPLVVAREDDLLGCTPSGDGSLLGSVDMDEAMQDVEPRVLGPDPLPQVGGLVAVGVRRVALAEVVAEVERQEPCRLALELGGHRDGIRVDGEMHERAPPERDVLRIAVVAVLLDRVLDVLAGEVVLQLRRCDRDAVEEEAEIDRLVRIGIERELSCDGQPVGVVVGDQLRRDAECGLAIREADLDVLIADAVPDDVDGAALIDLLRQPLHESLARELFVAAVGLDELAPLRALRQLDERKEFDGVESELRIEVLPPLWIGPELADAIAAGRNQVAADLVFEKLLADRTHAASGMSSWPVTAAVMSACDVPGGASTAAKARERICPAASVC